MSTQLTQLEMIFLWGWGESFCIFDRLINIFHIIEEELHILDLFDCVNNIN